MKTLLLPALVLTAMLTLAAACSKSPRYPFSVYGPPRYENCSEWDSHAAKKACAKRNEEVSNQERLSAPWR